MKDKLWAILAFGAAIILSLWLWNRPAHSAPAQWYVVEWYPTRIATTPQKTHEECKRIAAERAKERHAACLSKAELDALKMKESVK